MTYFAIYMLLMALVALTLIIWNQGQGYVPPKDDDPELED
jgi:hypothetical protein